ncbi:MAG TPA: pyruvate carboxylase subunit B, partial [Bacteroidales bacterium]|nr:pyruvate carboxylase subunit B [Bacteroidales bacterium]
MKAEAKTLRITDTTLRDAHQSLWATRMKTEDMLGIIDAIDKAGYYSLEVWGGATFDVCLRYLYEDPWERLRLIKSKALRTPLQMLLRGQNIVGYKNYPDDLVDRFVAIAHQNGVDIFRIFDALNDTRNLEVPIRAVKKYGAHAQGTLSYTISPIHTVEKYVQYAKEQASLGIDSLCIKDMAGILSPDVASALVSAIKRELDIPVQLHCHSTSGMASAAYLEGVKAGAGAVDCAIASMAGFSSQPPVETLIAMLAAAGYEINLDIDALRSINKYFHELYPKRSKGRPYEPIIDSEILIHQIPGGMISNFRSQLEQQGAIDKLPEVLEEVTKVRKDLGYPPLVTPTSQIVGTQAVMNVITGQRYKMVPQEVKNYVKGMYGRPPDSISPEFINQILGDEKPIDHRPADDLQPILPSITKNISNPDLITSEEDILSYCIFPEVAMEFFKWRALPTAERPLSPADIEFEEIAGSKLTVNESKSKPETLLHSDDYSGLNSIIKLASAMNLSEIIIKKGEFSMVLRAGNGVNSFEPATNKQLNQIIDNQHVNKISQPKQEIVKDATPNQNHNTIDAVMAGTFYRAGGEGKPP